MYSSRFHTKFKIISGQKHEQEKRNQFFVRNTEDVDVFLDGKRKYYNFQKTTSDLSVSDLYKSFTDGDSSFRNRRTIPVLKGKNV